MGEICSGIEGYRRERRELHCKFARPALSRKSPDQIIFFTQQILQGVDKRLHAILQLQQMSRGREARDYNLLLDNEAYVQYWSMAQCLVVIGCFLVQVYFVKKLFDTKSGRGRI